MSDVGPSRPRSRIFEHSLQRRHTSTFSIAQHLSRALRSFVVSVHPSCRTDEVHTPPFPLYRCHANANNSFIQRLDSAAPLGYSTPVFPSLYWPLPPGAAQSFYLYNPGDILRLNRATHIGSRDYTLKAPESVKGNADHGKKVYYLDERLFTCRARVVGVESEPLRIEEKTKRRQRHTKHVKSKLHFTVLKISDLEVKSLEEYEAALGQEEKKSVQ